jgi:hypothetical protein
MAVSFFVNRTINCLRIVDTQTPAALMGFMPWPHQFPPAIRMPVPAHAETIRVRGRFTRTRMNPVARTRAFSADHFSRACGLPAQHRRRFGSTRASMQESHASRSFLNDFGTADSNEQGPSASRMSLCVLNPIESGLNALCPLPRCAVAPVSRSN